MAPADTRRRSREITPCRTFANRELGRNYTIFSRRMASTCSGCSQHFDRDTSTVGFGAGAPRRPGFPLERRNFPSPKRRIGWRNSIVGQVIFPGSGSDPRTACIKTALDTPGGQPETECRLFSNCGSRCSCNGWRAVSAPGKGFDFLLPRITAATRFSSVTDQKPIYLGSPRGTASMHHCALRWIWNFPGSGLHNL